MAVAVVVLALLLTAGGAKRKPPPKAGGGGLLLVLLVAGLAVAAAPGSSDGQPSAGTGGLTPEMVEAVAQLEAAMGEPLVVNSGYRSAADQARVCATGVRPCAPPGRSLHQAGLAVDVANWALAARTLQAHPEIPLCQPMPDADPVHLSHRNGSEC